MYIVINAVLAVAVLLLSLSYLAYRKVFYYGGKKKNALFRGLSGDLSETKKKRKELLEATLKIPYKSVTVKSFDGKRLFARYYHVLDGAPLAILYHGYKSLGVRDFSGILGECLKLGLNVLLPDARSHGESEGNKITFGIKERFDFVRWTEYATLRFGPDVKIIFFGISMGGATALMAAELDLPENVVGIIADCPYSSTRAIIKKVCRDMRLPGALLYPFIKLGALIFGGFNPDKATPRQAAFKAKIPILLIHGEGDRFVPASMSDEIAKDCKAISYMKIPEATHAASFIYDTGTYVGALRDFTSKILKKDTEENS